MGHDFDLQMEIVHNPDKPPPPAVTPVERGGRWWSGQGKWGATWSGRPGVLGLPNGDRDIIVFPEFVGEGSPRLYEIHLSQRYLNTVPPHSPVANFYCHVLYGVGQANHEIECDWHNGARVIVPAGSVTVTCRQRGVSAAQLLLSASIAAHPGGMVSRPTWTPYFEDYRSVAAATGHYLQPLPAHATGLVVNAPDIDFDPTLGRGRINHVRVISSDDNVFWNTACLPEMRTAPGILIPGDVTAVDFTPYNPQVSWSYFFLLD